MWPLLAILAVGLGFAITKDKVLLPALPRAKQPKNLGVPFAAPTGKVWPIKNGIREVPFTDLSGVFHGNAGTAFAAARATPAGRKHAAIDVVSSPGQAVLATEDGIVSAVIPQEYVRLDAVVIQHPTVAILYGEIHRDPNLKVGSRVKAGQQIGVAAENYENNSMLHFETWQKAFEPKHFTQWIGQVPKGLLDPTLYLLSLAQR